MINSDSSNQTSYSPFWSFTIFLTIFGLLQIYSIGKASSQRTPLIKEQAITEQRVNAGLEEYKKMEILFQNFAGDILDLSASSEHPSAKQIVNHYGLKRNPGQPVEDASSKDVKEDKDTKK